jgi:prepilin peptidase CpaA
MSRSQPVVVLDNIPAFTCCLGFLALVAHEDACTLRISNRTNLAGMTLALVLALIPGGTTLSASLLGGAICFVPMLGLWFLKGVGGGDVKLAAVLGTFLAWDLGLSALLWAHLVHGAAAVAGLLVGYGVRAIGRILVFAFRPSVPHGLAPAADRMVSGCRWTQQPRPMGIWFLVGTVAAVLERGI